ncbi:YceI family protein [Fulvivirga lutimaris]|uniref:YceI family protein n=1 Tax=Fulvivirga lutimaris TaxID=1819566 RepID=UPI0012BC9D58|nr:YceI family protein [Fulvivirga lutimaris]MTI38384.1 YceI family protein [Fulvivirga lutimaris]
MKSLLTFTFYLAFNILQAQNQELSGNVSFIIKNAGLNVDGNIGGIQGAVIFNEQQPSQSKISVTIDPTTIDTGIGLRDKHLKKEDYFDVDQYPAIKMQSTAIVKKGDVYEGIFELTMKGVTKELTIPFTVSKENNQLHFKAIFELDRLDFNVGGNSWVLSDDVKVNVELVLG